MQLPFYMFSTSMPLEDRLRLSYFLMYGYNAGPPMAIPIYTVLPYCVSRSCRGKYIVVGDYRVRWSSCNLHLYNYTYKASKCKCTIIRLHCATSKSSLWNMEYVARGSAFEHPHIYCTNLFIMYIYIYIPILDGCV